MADSVSDRSPAGADVEAARGSAGTDPASADLAVSVVGRLFRLAPQLTDLLDLGAREYGMGFARGRVLWALQESGPVVMRALSQQLGISPRTVTGLIDALEADGWVTRTPHPDDRRATIISITPTAEAALTTLRSSYEGLAHDLLAGLGHVETTMLKPDGSILSARLDPEARANLESWMREAGLPVDE